MAGPVLGLGMLTILTINLDNGLSTARSNALMADAQVVYGSQNSLYVTTEKWIAPATPPDQLPQAQVTQIDRFDASDPDRTAFVASGEVPGYLLNQFSLSESGGYLRVASTSRPDWWGGAVPQLPSQSYVTVLRTQGNQLHAGGQISGLGRGQKIYSVRFVGGVGYVVTFRQIDPLYTIDLSEPASPRVAGKLELQGYSSYLHPLSDGLLLGIGQDVGAGKRALRVTAGAVSMCPTPARRSCCRRRRWAKARPRRPNTTTTRFLYWAPTKLAVLPVQIYPTQSEPPSGPPTGDHWTTRAQRFHRRDRLPTSTFRHRRGRPDIAPANRGGTPRRSSGRRGSATSCTPSPQKASSPPAWTRSRRVCSQPSPRRHCLPPSARRDRLRAEAPLRQSILRAADSPA